MKILCQSRLFAALLGLWLSASVSAQTASTWQYFTHPDFLPAQVTAVDVAPDGVPWFANGSKVSRFDGTSWQSYDFVSAGISVLYNYIRSIAHAPDSKIWCGTFNRVLEFDPATHVWVLHNPSNSATNLNGYDITAGSDGKIWWATSSGSYVRSNNSWSNKFFYFPGPFISSYSIREILIDPEQNHWFVTSGSIAFHTGQITPAGVIFESAADTILYTGATLGAPQSLSILSTPNLEGYPLALVGGSVLSFEFGAWQNWGPRPLLQTRDVFMDNVGCVWVAGLTVGNQPLVLRRLPNGVWQEYPLDDLQIIEPTCLTGSPDGNIWVGGRNVGNAGVIAMLPPQPISSVKDLPEICAVEVRQSGDFLTLKGLQEGTVEASVFDVQGRQTTQFEMNGSEAQRYIGDWPAGVYFIKITGQKDCLPRSIKFVKL